jgi:hypothetical protein
MSVLARAMCAMGRHSGQWSHPGSRCEVVRICDACGTREEETHHVWGEFGYVGAGRCDQTRRCERCGSTQSRIAHDWGPWFYHDAEFTSGQVRTCRRCHEAERTRYTMR